MSKKTRKKSSKASSRNATTPTKAPAKHRQQPQRHPPKKRPRRRRPAAAAKASVKTPAAKARQGGREEIGKAAKSRFDQRIPQAGVEIVKIQATGGAETEFEADSQAAPPRRTPGPARRRPWLKAPKPPASGCPATAATASRWPIIAGQKLVLFFYPRADTPGCTREAIDFTRLKDAFAESGTAVLGISADTVKAQESFRNKHQLSIPLISDEKHEMLEAYGAWGEKSMYGRTFLGILRTTVLIGADGKIAKIWRNVRVDGHADEVLAAAQAI